MADQSDPQGAGAHSGLEPVLRMSGKMLLMVVAIVASVYALLPQLTDLRGAAEQVRQAQWGWAVLVVLLVPVTFVGATLSISGAVPERLATTPTFLTQVATSFSNKLAPSTVGGMTLNIRFVQHQGVDRGAATASVGLNAMGGWVVHTVLLVLFAVGAGRSAFGDVKLPNPEALLIGAGVVCVLAVAVLAIPSVRSMMADKALPTLRRSATGLRSVLHRPAKVTELLGGNLVVVLSLLACFVCSIAAFGGGLRLVTLGAVYLVGSSVAMIAPTPSGLGAVEAALVAGLVAAGMEGSVAVPAVFLFRLTTFWLPILPGWVCLSWLRRHDNV